MSSDPWSPQISVERYAAIAVALRQPFAPRSEILDDAGLTEDAWRRTDKALAERVQQDPTASQRYQRAFREAGEALRAGAAPREMANAVQLAEPRVVGAEPEKRDVLPPPVNDPPSAEGHGLLVMGSMPTTTAAGNESSCSVKYPTPNAFVVPHVASPTNSVDVTLSPHHIDLPVLPFDDSQATAAPPRLPASAREASDEGGETMELQLGHLFSATPFDAEASVDTTVVAAPLENREALPFRPDDDAPPPPPANISDHEAIGETAFHTALDFEDPLPFDAPFDRLAHPFRAAPLTLAQLAAIHVEFQYAERQQVLARYHLTQAIFAQLETERRALPSEDARFAGAWDEACQAYRTWRESKDDDRNR